MVPASFSLIFSLFKQIIQFLTRNQCKKCHVHPVNSTRIQTHDLCNMSLSPITPRPGLLSLTQKFLYRIGPRRQRKRNLSRVSVLFRNKIPLLVDHGTYLPTYLPTYLMARHVNQFFSFLGGQNIRISLLIITRKFVLSG